MKLVRLYSNQSSIFPPIEFNKGLSVILAEIRVPENRLLDTHNLGKSTVADLLDFCLLKGKSSSFFLFKYPQLFEQFVFYLEIQLAESEYVTIARPVSVGTRVHVKRSSASIEDASQFDESDWDHSSLPFEKAKSWLDGEFKLDALKPWTFRKLVGYLFRSQRDYSDVFQLGKFSGKHLDWKPFVAHIIGLDSKLVADLYDTRERVAESENNLRTLVGEWGAGEVDTSVIDAILAVKRQNIRVKASSLDSFSFHQVDREANELVVDEIENRIRYLNEEAYRLRHLVARLGESLRDGQVLFNVDETELLFREAGIAFGGQLRRDFVQLIEFNKAISQERNEGIRTQLADCQNSLQLALIELEDLNEKRAAALRFLNETDSMAKFKELSREVSDLQSEIAVLDAKRAGAKRLMELRQSHRRLLEECGNLETRVEQHVEEVGIREEDRFGQLRRYFNEIVFHVVGKNAVLAVRLNSAKGIEFTAEFIGESGLATSDDRGTSYKKLLCVAFDLAMLRTHLDVNFPRFVYHDGALEQLEPRKREKLIEVFREYAALGLQPVLSALDTEVEQVAQPFRMSEEVVRTLHDEGPEGRLFIMEAW
jgi:uncharacterized protein YydD (DUF2326 family)